MQRGWLGTAGGGLKVSAAANVDEQRRLILQSCDDSYLPLVALARERHAAYAARWGYDYAFHLGSLAAPQSAAYNKILLMHQALVMGYQEVLWLDADTLIFADEQPIFPVFRDQGVVVAMAQFDNVQVYGRPHHNTGVLFIRRSRGALHLLRWVWRNRARWRPEYEFRYEQNQVLEYLANRQHLVQTLDHRYNHISGLSDPAIAPLIKGYHGMGDQRLDAMREDLRHLGAAPS